MSRITVSCLRAAALAGLLGSCLVVVTTAPASAAAITVTTTADVVDGGDGLTSLREAFTTASGNGADDVITLGAGLTYPLSVCSGPLTHADNHELVVQGNNSTIEQTCDAKGVVNSTSHDGRLELRDLVIDGGPNTTNTALEGAAVRSDSELMLNYVEVRNVLSPGGSVVWSSFGHGTTPYRMTLLAGSLHDNTGSVISCDNCSLSINGTSISDNTGSGLSLVDGYPVSLESTTITNNTRTGISNSGQGFAANTMEIDQSNISGNGRAGILCSNCGDLRMYSTGVSGNGLTAADARGGISFTAFKRGNGSTGIYGLLSSVTGNRSTQPGGGISLTPVLIEDQGVTPDVGLDRVLVEDNQSVGGGGGVWLGFGALHMYKGSLIGNSTTGGNGGGAGTVDTTGPFDMSFDETPIDHNSATGDGGGLYAQQITQLFVDRTGLSDNTAGGNGGGAKVDNSMSVYLSDMAVDNNKAVNGAGLDVATEGLTGEKLTFAGNVATGTGGGARMAAVSASFLNSTFNGNTAATGGGLAVTNAAVTTLTHVTMADDQATTGAHIAAVPAAQVRSEKSAIVLPKVGTSCAGIGGAFAGTSLGFSVRRDASCGSIASDLVTAADPQLGALGGLGFARVRVPAATSPLGGRVPVANCLVEDDQRMTFRPSGANCEAGSVEIVEAPGADAALTTLTADVKGLHLPKAVEASLVLKLGTARSAVQKGQNLVAKAALTAFVIEVKVLAAKKVVPAAAAGQLVAKATAVKNSL
ncbi:right-handed parallel beta-helix repeat-containing protein [Kribbella sp. DT2]|uniref:right-handed parallel beta-helix repeat-containing protein n=1 Tax=Kribbella sp. DT2 TaxID=3393427 RepID=UPI003CF2DFC4